MAAVSKFEEADDAPQFLPSRENLKQSFSEHVIFWGVSHEDLICRSLRRASNTARYGYLMHYGFSRFGGAVTVPTRRLIHPKANRRDGGNQISAACASLKSDTKLISFVRSTSEEPDWIVGGASGCLWPDAATRLVRYSGRGAVTIRPGRIGATGASPERALGFGVGGKSAKSGGKSAKGSNQRRGFLLAASADRSGGGSFSQRCAGVRSSLASRLSRSASRALASSALTRRRSITRTAEPPRRYRLDGMSVKLSRPVSEHQAADISSPRSPATMTAPLTNAWQLLFPDISKDGPARVSFDADGSVYVVRPPPGVYTTRMYVRWQWRYERRLKERQRKGQRRRERRRYRPPAWSYAILVENGRIDGKPKQRHVAYLGSVHLDQTVHYRAWWWHRISAKLDALGNRIPADDRPRIEAALAKEVPKVSAADVAAYASQHGSLDWPGAPPRPKKAMRWTNVLETLDV